ncbi:hypothetical protein RAB80_017209 [Fusarium oxysporum f. sp. vasinfectum]|nr:hypothetical protein RAB80_017209 [Fusarium oxysporum f. sp. vasinfectum]
MRAHGIVNAQRRPHFLYQKLILHTPECNVFKFSNAYNFEVRPMLGHFQYDELVKKRERAIKPRRHPVPGSSNLPRRATLRASIARLDSRPVHLRHHPRTRLPSRHPPKLLRALDNPTEDMDNLVWPAIQHIQVPFEPHASFSERVAGQLLASLKTRAPEETPRGEKRKRDKMETEEETKSVKAWDGTVQVASVPLANG